MTAPIIAVLPFHSALWIALVFLPFSLPVVFLIRRSRAHEHAFAAPDRAEVPVLASLVALRRATRPRRLAALVCTVALQSSYFVIEELTSHACVGAALVVAYIVLIIVWTLQPLWSQRAQEELRSRAFRVCPRCEYDLRAHPETGVCPECGLRYDDTLLRAVWEKAFERGLQADRR